MTLVLGSVLLSLVNLVSAALIAEHRRAGWLVALAAQIPWAWYDVSTRQVGFLLLTLVYVPVYLRGWRKERRAALPAVETTRAPSAVAGTRPARTRCCASSRGSGQARPTRQRHPQQPRRLSSHPAASEVAGPATGSTSAPSRVTSTLGAWQRIAGTAASGSAVTAGG